MKFGEMDKCVA